jgi:trehalose/maltose hydrolase-like predicted phosphorylase
MWDAMQPTPNPAWVLDQQGSDPLRDTSRESRFAVSNGFLGVRGGQAVNRSNETLQSRTYVAGLFDTVRDPPLPALVQAPDWQTVRISLSGVALAVNIDVVQFHQRLLDLKRGALLTESHMSGLL